MSKQLEIYIDGNRLNFLKREGFPVSLDISIESAEDPSKVNGSYSKRSVSFPGDGVTGQLFEEWVTVTRQNPTAANRKPARIEVNSLPVLTGVAQIEEAITKGNRYNRATLIHKAGIFGNNAAWFDELKAIRIREMGLIPEHDLTPTNVAANDDPDPDTDDWGYFVVRWNDWDRGGGVNISYVDLQPFLFIRSILVEAFRQVGYVFNSDFFDTDFGKRLILPVLFRPYPGDVIQQWQILIIGEDNTTTINSGSLTHIIPDGSLFSYNVGGYFDEGTGNYTVPISGYYIIGVAESTVQITQRARKNGTDLGAFTDPCEIGIGVQKRVFLEKDDIVDVAAQGIITPTGYCFLYVRPDMGVFEEGTGVRFDLYGNPDWKPSDIILGITHAFGLVWDTDYDAGTVRCEPRDRYKTSQQPSTENYHEGFYRIAERNDITPLIDLSKNGAVSALNNEREATVLGWKSDSADPNVEILETDAIDKLYDGRYTFPTGRFRKGETRSENPFFAKTMHVFENAIMHSTSTKTPQIPLIQKERYGVAVSYLDERGEYEPRLLWFAGRRSGLDGYANLEDLGQYDFPAAFMVNYNDTTGLDPSLSFANELLVDGTTEAIGLMQRLHLQRLKRLEVGKLLTEWVFWRDLDITNLDFRKKLLIDDALFLFQKIDGFQPLSNGSTETELLYDAIPDADDVLKVSGSELSGYIINVTPNGE